MPKELQRINEEALLRFLNTEKGMLAETLILLAWKLGLTRDEIYNLKWENISFSGQTLQLPDRTIPMDTDTYHRLYERYDLRGRFCEYVAAADRGAARVNKNYIPICVRKALDRGGFSDLDTLDLRSDFIIRNLEAHDVAYVSRISGLSVRTLKEKYGEFIRPTPTPAEKQPVSIAEVDARMQDLVKAEKDPVGLAIWLCWKLNMTILDAVALVWDQVDLSTRIIHGPQGYIFIDDTLEELLLKAAALRDETSDPHVILGPKAKKPMRPERLSRVMRDALIRGGIGDTLLEQLKAERARSEKEEMILQYVQDKRSISMNEAKEVLNATYVPTYACIQRLKEQGKLVMVGTRYYLAGTVVPPEQQEEAIFTYLKEKEKAELGELAQRLGIGNRQCGWILRGLVEEGKVVHANRKYRLVKTE